MKNLAGMILEKTGRTSHTLILARASAIPVLSGLPLDAIARYAGQPAVLDAQCGVLAINPNDAVSGYYQVAQTLADKRQKQQAQAAAQLAYSRDNKRIDIAANMGTALEAPRHVCQRHGRCRAVPYRNALYQSRQRAGRAGAI
ncbi:PEP-utilizing enzyme [Shigella flexneri]